MSHSVIDTADLGGAVNRYGPTAAREVSTKPIRLPTTTVDTHAHVFIAEAAKYIAPLYDLADIPFVRYTSDETRKIQMKQDADRTVALADVADRIAVLDAQNIDIQVVAPVPNQCYYMARGEHAAKVSRLVNDGMAAWVGEKPDRLAGLGTAPLQEPQLAVTELEYAVGKLGLKGVQILTNVEGEEISSDRFEPFWAKAEELGAVVMLHPMGFTHSQRFSEYYFANVIGNPLDTTVALHYVIFSGLLERHPGLKIFAVHGGGFLPAYSGRIDHAWGARAEANRSIPKPPTDYLKMMYFDTTVFTPHQLEYLVAQYGADHVVMGTDYPYDMAEYYPVEHIVSAPSLDDGQKAAVAGETAVKLFGLKGERR
jgi:aminocarboxymuconate-semialdehyde decarboxylase